MGAQVVFPALGQVTVDEIIKRLGRANHQRRGKSGYDRNSNNRRVNIISEDADGHAGRGNNKRKLSDLG